jgi:replicative DNA helicase
MADGTKGVKKESERRATTIESIVTATAIMYPATVPVMLSRIKSNMFANDFYRDIWDGITRLSEKNVKINVSNLVVEAKVPRSYIHDLVRSGEHTEDIDFVIEHFVSVYRLRVEEEFAIELGVLTRLDDATEEAIQEAHAKRAARISETFGGETVDEGKENEEWVKALLERKRRRDEGGPEITGIPTGHQDMDKLLGGWQGGDLIIIGARPSVGKTAAALHFLKQASLKGYPVGMLSIEMVRKAIWNRVIAYDAGVDSRKIRDGDLHGADFEKVIAAAANMEGKLFKVIDNMTQIESIISRMSEITHKQGIKLWAIDYIQLASYAKQKDKRLEVGEIAKRLKLFAKTHDVPVIALSQLKRLDGKRPRMEDLRETGELEAHADKICLLSCEPSTNTTVNLTFDWAKNRDGAIDVFEKEYHRHTGQIVDLPFQTTPF